MKFSSANRGFPAGNPIANIFVVVVGVLAIGVSIVLGFVAFVVLGSIVAVLAAIVGLRLWWFNRKLRRRPETTRPNESTAGGGVIEGEFHVIESDRHREGKDRPDE